MQIYLESLAKTYRGSVGNIHAVQNVSLSIPSNTVYGIIGKSGAGKSTLVRLISLLEKPDTGKILYNNDRVDSLNKKELITHRRRLGMIFQNFNLFSSRTAGENVAYPLEIAGLSKAYIKKRVAALLELVDLADRSSAPISTLSGGQKQRIAIARALANKPDILFCDEATSALDPHTTRAILQLIRDIQKKMNLTVVMITHQMEVVRDVCDEVAVLDDGFVVEQGFVSDIFAHPQSAVTCEFLANLLIAEPFSENVPTVDGSLVRWSKDGGEFTLRFVGESTGDPVLSRLSRLFEVEFNIRAGGIQHLPQKNIGTLITDISGSHEELTKALAWLEDQGIIVEKTQNKEVDNG